MADSEVWGKKLQQGVKAVRKEPGRDRDGRWNVLGRAESGVLDHGLDWLDASDGFLREGETEGDSAEQFTVDIDRATAHALQNAGFCQRTAAQAGEDDGLPWTEILEDSEDLDLEVFNSITLEDRFADAAKSGADILDWEKILTGGERD
jgi:hypothetical protein